MNELARSVKIANLIEIILKITEPISSSPKLVKHLVVLSILLLHIFLSFHFKDFSWLASAGGVIAGFALILVFYESSLSQFKNGVKNCYLYEPEPIDYLPEYAISDYPSNVNANEIQNGLKERRKYFNKTYHNVSLYFWYTVIGVLLNSYGQHLDLLFQCK